MHPKRTKAEPYEAPAAELPPRCAGVRDVSCNRLATHGVWCQECYEQTMRIGAQREFVTPPIVRHGRSSEAVMRQYGGDLRD